MSTNDSWREKWLEISPIGGGGQGDTILVRSTNGDVSRAVLKLLKPHKVSDPTARGRMAQEVINLRVLRQAGGKVPHILDDNTGRFEDLDVPLYFVMEFIPGETLAKTISSGNGLSVESAINVALELCLTMRIAIENGIQHRDIKPENIIVRSFAPEDIVMVDFGLSFNKDVETNFTSVDESLENKFLSLPERRGPGENKRDYRSDITGICAILLYCITKCSPRNLRDSQGRPPHRFPGHLLSDKVLIENQLSSLNLLLNKGLAYEIDARFQSIDELIARLKEVVNPSITEHIETLEIVLARETAALRKNDRKTQLAEQFKLAMLLSQPMGLKMNDLTRRLQTSSSFSLSWSGLFAESKQKTPIGDVLVSFTITVGIAAHTVRQDINFKIASQGMDCAICVEVIECWPAVNGVNKSKVVLPSKMVLRYEGDPTSRANVLISNVELHVTKAIASISQAVLNGP